MDLKLNFNDILEDLKLRGESYKTNDKTYSQFVGQDWGFDDGMKFTLLKLWQLGYIKTGGNEND